MVNKNINQQVVSLKGNSGYTDHRRGCLGSQELCLFVGSLIAFAPVLQVKDTGKSRERVKPVELNCRVSAARMVGVCRTSDRSPVR